MKDLAIFFFILFLVIGAYYLMNKKSGWDSDYQVTSEEVHVHSDFLVYINDKKWDFTEDKYQSTVESIKNPDIHLHDNQGNIIHRHAEGITLGEFFNSIGFELSNECLKSDSDEEYCTNESNVFQVYVNNEQISNPSEYINQDNDQILFYYGSSDSPNLSVYLNNLSDEACIYSGTCPERGTPPPEACGLTCEI